MAPYLTNKIREEIGEKLTKQRKKKNLNQVDVAVGAGINSSYYSKIERGEVNPSLEVFYKIVKTLGARSSDILPF